NPRDGRLVLHPPGYAIVMAATFSLFDRSDSGLRAAQVVADAIASVLAFLIAAELLPLAVAVIAGALVAVSPHLAYYSLWLSPESLAVLPLLIALYLILVARARPRLWRLVLAGALVGLSCWLRANAMMLAPVLALFCFVLFDRGHRAAFAVAIVASAAAV